MSVRDQIFYNGLILFVFFIGLVLGNITKPTNTVQIIEQVPYCPKENIYAA